MIDGFTAKTLLEAAASGTDVTDLYKELKCDEDGGPSDEARAFFQKHQGKQCRILCTTHTGIIIALNESTAGFYPGSRYPIKIKITSPGEASGCVFEYDLEYIDVIAE